MPQIKFPDWATTDISDIGNGDPNKVDPGTTKQAEGWEVEKPLLQHMNWLQNLQGDYIRKNNEMAMRTTGYIASPGELVIADNLTGPCQILLPDQPLDGQWVSIFPGGSILTQPITILGNGNNIMVASDQTCQIDIDWTLFRFFWNDFTSTYRIIQQGVVGR